MNLSERERVRMVLSLKEKMRSKTEDPAFTQALFKTNNG
jgi:hypothetical protein